MSNQFFIFKYSVIGLFFFIFSNSSKAQTQMEPLKTSGYAPVNGIKMYYETYGNGDIPLVLVHGGGSTIETSFSAILPLLAVHGKVIAVELQAHGRTSDRNAAESFTQDADDVAALLKYLKVGKANFLGFSNGGSTVLQIAIRHPLITNKIIPISAAYRRDGLIAGFFDGMQLATIDNMPAQLKTAFLKVNPDPNKLLTMFNKDKDRMITFKDWPDEELKAIKAPTLVMVADQDVITIEHSSKLAKLIPNAQLTVLPGIHGSFIGEICTAKPGSKLPTITVDLIIDFLKE